MVWIKRWAGSYTFISCSYWGKQYNLSLKKKLGIGFDNTLFIHRKGTVSFFVDKRELDTLGGYLANQTAKDNKLAINYCQELKDNTDILMPILNKLSNKIPSAKEYANFLKYFDKHLALHVFVKKTVDYLPLELLDKLLPYFNDARKYSEQIYSKSESFFRNIMKLIAKKEDYDSDILTCLTQNEFEEYLKHKSLPDKNILTKRFECSALVFEDNEERIILGKEVDKLERDIAEELISNKEEIKGVIAFKGKLKGTVRVIKDPHKVNLFNKGDILVTGQTRPEFMPLIKKASAIITDSGGVLCHAAITCREMKIPGIVGTEVATFVLKDGDLIELDANKGIISIIKRA